MTRKTEDLGMSKCDRMQTLMVEGERDIRASSRRDERIEGSLRNLHGSSRTGQERIDTANKMIKKKECAEVVERRSKPVRTRCFEILYLLVKECKAEDIDQNMLVQMLTGYR